MGFVTEESFDHIRVSSVPALYGPYPIGGSGSNLSMWRATSERGGEVIRMANGVQCTMNPNIGGGWPYSCDYDLNPPYPGGMSGGSGNFCTGDLQGSPDIKSCKCTKKGGGIGASIGSSVVTSTSSSNPFDVTIIPVVPLVIISGIALAGIIGFVVYKRRK